MPECNNQCLLCAALSLSHSTKGPFSFLLGTTLASHTDLSFWKGLQLNTLYPQCPLLPAALAPCCENHTLHWMDVTCKAATASAIVTTTLFPPSSSCHFFSSQVTSGPPPSSLHSNAAVSFQPPFQNHLSPHSPQHLGSEVLANKVFFHRHCKSLHL